MSLFGNPTMDRRIAELVSEPPARSPFGKFCDELFPDFFPPRAWEEKAARVLYVHGFSLGRSRAILDHLATYGTAECCPVPLAGFTREDLEAVLPGDARDWPTWTDEGFWIGTPTVVVHA